MHMGHSHSHHHRHAHSHSPTPSNKKPSIPKGWRGKLLVFSSRRTVRILFAALITLLPPILKHQSLLHGITRTDVGVFLVTSGILSIFDRIRADAKALIAKGESWRLSVLKLSAPISADYFFRNENAADRVTFLGLFANLLLSASKFAVGVACHSSVLVSDAGHSLSDLFSDFVTLWAVQVARLPPDEGHPYGYGKFESVGSLLLSCTLLYTGFSIGVSSYVKFLRVVHAQRSVGVAAAAALVRLPTWPALVMAGASIASKEWLYRITRRVGEEVNSQVVIANAWHHRSDAFSSVLAVFSIGLAITFPGFSAADPFAGVLVAGMIAMTGAEIMGESVKQLTDAVDAVTDEELVRNVKAAASYDADIQGVTRVRARQVGSSALVDVEVEVPRDLSASAMRAIEKRTRVRIISEVEGILDVEVRATGEDGEWEVEHTICATQVEREARALLTAHPSVLSVRGVTVHYQDAMLVRVDANICVGPHTSVFQANTLAGALREKLEESADINKANIFLDLNAAADGVNGVNGKAPGTSKSQTTIEKFWLAP